MRNRIVVYIYIYICICMLVFCNYIVLFECNALFLFQDFQKEIVKAAETFTAIGYKHIETGENLVYFLH